MIMGTHDCTCWDVCDPTACPVCDGVDPCPIQDTPVPFPFDGPNWIDPDAVFADQASGAGLCGICGGHLPHSAFDECGGE